jgi:Rrf2 family protein
MILSKTTSYGIRALAYIASQPEPRLLGLQEIAAHENIPPAYLRKILGELRRHRLLRSVKGIHGGYELGRSAEEITLWEVFKVLEPDPYMDTCILGNRVCTPDAACAFHNDWQDVRKQLVALLETRTISEAAAEISRPRRVGNSPQPTAANVEIHDPGTEQTDVSNPT